MGLQAFASGDPLVEPIEDLREDPLQLELVHLLGERRDRTRRAESRHVTEVASWRVIIATSPTDTRRNGGADRAPSFASTCAFGPPRARRQEDSVPRASAGAEHLRVVRIADAVDLLAARGDESAVFEDGHGPSLPPGDCADRRTVPSASTSSCVAARTSSTFVSP